MWDPTTVCRVSARRFGMARLSWGLLLILGLVFSISVVKSELVDEESPTEAEEEVGVVDEGEVNWFDAVGSADGVETVYYFPNNPQKLVPAGEVAKILVGINNNGGSALTVNSIRASLHLPFDHKLLVQNLTAQDFGNATVPVGVQATFAYPFAVSKFLQPGSFSLVASVIYEIDGDIHKNVFYNGTVEVVEAGSFLSGETMFLITLGLGLLGLLGLWIQGQVTRFSKTRRTKVVETGTKNADAINDEWLQGTAFMLKQKSASSLPSKTKKKK